MKKNNLFKTLILLLVSFILTGCGPSTSEPTVNDEPTSHTHTYASTYSYDEDFHWYASTCGHDDTVNKVSHSFDKEVIPSTFEEKGYTKYTCKECGFSYNDDETDVLKHNFSSKLSYDEQTHWYSCTDKGYEHLKKDEAPHDFKSTVTKPTFEEKGYTTYSCKSCEYSYKANETDVLKHNYSTTYSYNETHHWFACTDKGYENLKKGEEKHTFTHKTVDPTYESKGYTTHTCSVCKYSYTDTYIDALTHNYSTTYSYNETHHWFACLDSGYENLKKDEKPHNYNVVTVPSTYEEEGFTTYTCKDCGYSYNGNYTPLLRYKIIYHLDGGINSEYNPDSFTINDFVSLKPAKKDGYAFAGWFDNSGNEVTTIEQGTNHDVEVTAKWEDIFVIQNNTITSFDDSYGQYEVVIPDGVTKIGKQAFFKSRYVQVLYIPSSVTTFEEDAFDECYNLSYIFYKGTIEQWCNITFASVAASPMFYGQHFLLLNENNEWEELTNLVIPNSITSISNYTFLDFDYLKSVTISKNVAKLNYFSFFQCVSLETVTFEEGSKCTTIGESAFNKCYELKSIVLPSSIITIETEAFEYCESLVSIEIPNSVKTLGNGVFSNCKSLVNVTIPNTITAISDYLFASCTSLKTITLPTTIKSIGIFAFSSCVNLYKIEIPSGVTSIGDYAFDYCGHLYSVKIPSTVTTIGSYAFRDCSSVIFYVQASSKPSGWKSSWNPLDYPVYWGKAASDVYEKDGIEYIVSNKKAVVTNCLDTVTQVTIPESVTIKNTSYSVTSIGDYAFYFKENIQHLILPNTMTTFGEDSFYGTSLYTIVIPTSVTKIKTDTFRSCWYLTIFCLSASKPSGWESDWNYDCDVYWAGQWSYDSNGIPVANAN